MKFDGMRKASDIRKAWVKEGQELKGVFRGNPYRFLSHWIPDLEDPKKKKREYCQGENCDICMSGQKARWEFRINFIQKDQDANLFFSAVYEGNDFAYNKLGALNDEFPLEQNLVKISKKEEFGYKSDHFSRIRELDLEISKIIDTVPLIDLKAL